MMKRSKILLSMIIVFSLYSSLLSATKKYMDNCGKSRDGAIILYSEWQAIGKNGYELYVSINWNKIKSKSIIITECKVKFLDKVYGDYERMIPFDSDSWKSNKEGIAYLDTVTCENFYKKPAHPIVLSLDYKINEDPAVEYTGSFNQGKKSGNGTEYDKNGYETCKGEYKDGVLCTGTCKKSYWEGEYTGDFESCERHGQGKMVYNNGDVFEGTWNNGSKYSGTHRYSNGEYATYSSGSKTRDTRDERLAREAEERRQREEEERRIAAERRAREREETMQALNMATQMLQNNPYYTGPRYSGGSYGGSYGSTTRSSSFNTEQWMFCDEYSDRRCYGYYESESVCTSRARQYMNSTHKALTSFWEGKSAEARPCIDKSFGSRSGRTASSKY